jgi:hypothetical protein
MDFMNQRTEKNIAYAILAQRAIEYGDGSLEVLSENYKYFVANGHSPIAAAILSQRSIKYGDVRNRLEELCKEFKKLTK